MRPELDHTVPASPGDRTATLPGTPQAKAALPAASADELPAGLQLGHFRVDKQLGAGGMGAVYLATDLALDRPVAIKVLPHAAASGRARDRLVREARAQARVQHPNVAHIYFVGEEAGRLYFAMEHIAGETLAQRLERGPLPVEQALAIIRDAVLGLREAQRAGITHRDVKPSNLMVDGHGVVKVLDFGLAAQAKDDGDADRTGEPGAPASVTQTTIGGTPLYMAPEQARGEPIDLRADIYALGATLYHLVSGKPPFQADSIDELRSLHATATRPPVPRGGGNPRTAIVAIDTMIARMMATAPGDRFASYDELLRAIDLASATHTRPAGFLVRLIARSIDGLFLVLLIAAAMALISGSDKSVNGSVILPLLLAFSAVTTARWGTSLGKALFELEVVDIDTGTRPGWRRTALRELWIAIPLLVGWGSELALDQLALPAWAREVTGLLPLLGVVVVVAQLGYAALRVPGKRAVWDRRAHTQVRYRTPRIPESTR